MYGRLDTSKVAWEQSALVLTSMGTQCAADRAKSFESRIFFECGTTGKEPVITIKAESFYGCYIEL